MHLTGIVLITTILCSPAGAGAGQASASGANAAQAGADATQTQTGSSAQTQQPASIPAIGASGVLQPALAGVQQTVTALRLDKWKRGTVRDETGENINAILRDLQVTLPPLLGSADAAQGTVSSVLPVSRNIDSLYDVLLRVVEAARVSAPGDDIVQLQQALVKLGGARRTLDDRLQEMVVSEEKQIVELRGALKAQSAVKCPAPAPATPACTTPPAPRKAKKKSATPAKPAPSPTSPAAASPKN